MSEIEINISKYSIQEKYGKLNGPQNVMFDITQRCNMHCMHCYNYSGDCMYNDLNDEQMIDVARQLLEIKPCLVCLCGGEPTIRMSLIAKITKLLSDQGIFVNMVSNGILLNEKNLQELYSNGMKNMQISLDSYKESTVDMFRGRNGAFKAAINAIENIKKMDRIPTVTFIPTKLNYKDVNGLARLLYEMGIKSVRYMPFIPIGRGNENAERLCLNSKENAELFWLIKSTEEELGDFSFEYGDPLEHIYLYRNNYLAATPSLEIKSNGDVQLSCYIPYIYGNVMTNTLKTLWDSGLRSIWRNPEFKAIVSKINTLYDLQKQSIMPYSGKDINLKM